MNDQQYAAAQDALRAAEQTHREAEASLKSIASRGQEIAARISEVRAEEVERKKNAALSGEPVAAVASEIPDLKAEAGEVEYALWAARIRKMEAEAAALEAEQTVLAERDRRISGELEGIAPQQQALETRRGELVAESDRVRNRASRGRSRIKTSRSELESHVASSPDQLVPR